MLYRVTKTWGHDLGLACAFRQWRAESHCHFVHGYALAISVTFQADKLDHHGWVIDFGALKPLKQWLADHFDHKTLIAADDPHLDWFKEGAAMGLVDLIVVDDVGCEAFATLVLAEVQRWLINSENYPRVRVVRVDVSEHGANTATVMQG